LTQNASEAQVSVIRNGLKLESMLTYRWQQLFPNTVKIAIISKTKFVKSALGNIFPSIEHGSTYISQKVDNFLLCLFNHEVNNSQYLMFGTVQN